MAKRKSDDGLEIVEQLRPDDTGWLAELRRARTDPIDLAAGASEATGPPPDPPSPQAAPSPPPPESEQPPPPEREQPPPPEREQPPLPASTQPPRPESTPPEREQPPLPASTQPPAPESERRPPRAPGWNRPTPPPARPRPAPLPTAPHRGPDPHYVDVTPRPARRPIQRRRGPRRWRVVLPVVALLCGAATGLAWRGTGAGTTPSAAGPASDAASRPVSTRTDPPRIVVITSVRDDGDSLRLAWIDPTAGQAQFVVSQIFDDAPARVYSVPRGQNEAIVTDLDPDATQYCFKVLAVIGGPDDVAISPVTCTDQRNPTSSGRRS